MSMEAHTIEPYGMRAVCLTRCSEAHTIEPYGKRAVRLTRCSEAHTIEPYGMRAVRLTRCSDQRRSCSDDIRTRFRVHSRVNYLIVNNKLLHEYLNCTKKDVSCKSSVNTQTFSIKQNTSNVNYNVRFH